MKKKWIMAVMSIIFTSTVLSACNNAGNDVNEDPENVNFETNRYQEGPDVDTDPRNVRDPNEADHPWNMDEEEPDPDEEPAEERRGM